ncbi:MAG: GIY-YIG nuclease family protein [Methylotenera sp.]|nr:GIY-YIG nuclease family protein [Oligoflexia bacterium]
MLDFEDMKKVEWELEPALAEETPPELRRQPWLLKYENPLKTRFGAPFFLALPKTPGIYRMKDEHGNVIYVGKAKVLRERLNSYRHARPGEVSRKVIRMIHLIRTIEWEECDSEASALLLENRLLRELAPPFNTVNTRPHTYSFIGLRVIELDNRCVIRLRLTMNCKRQGDLLFGAFKGRSRALRGYSALLRLFWATQSTAERFEYPPPLTRRSPPSLYSVELPKVWISPLREFLKGRSEHLISQLSCSLLENETLPRFYSHYIQEDLEALQSFFNQGPKRNLELRKNHGLRNRLIAQDRIDDLLVLEWERLGRLDTRRASKE